MGGDGRYGSDKVIWGVMRKYRFETLGERLRRRASESKAQCRAPGWTVTVVAAIIGFAGFFLAGLELFRH